jgi:amino acid adenylation domain-containing protein
VLPVIDLRVEDTELHNDRLRRLLADEAKRPFNLARDLMLRAVVYRSADEEWLLLINLHHIACDGQSVGLVLHEVGRFYDVFAAGMEPELPSPQVQCGDVSLWEEEVLTEELRNRQLNYWSDQLSGAPMSLELSSDKPRPLVISFRGGIEYCRIGKDLSDKLRQLSRRYGVTIFMALLAAMKVMLKRLSGQDDIIVGVSMTQRDRAEMAHSIGYFSNMMPLRTHVTGDMAFPDLLRAVRTMALGAYANHDVPFEDIVARLQPARVPGRNPLVEVIFNFEHASWHELNLGGLQSQRVPLHQDTARFDVNLSVVDEADGFQVALEYNSDIFHADTARRMLSFYEAIIRGIVADPNCRISRLPMLDERERFAAMSLNEERAWPTSQSVHGLVEQQVERTPDAIAVECGNHRLSYRELNIRANRLAHYLRKREVGPETLVGICMDRGIEMLVAILGVVKAGGAYVPLDPAHPGRRRLEMLVESGVRLLITQDKFLAERASPKSVKSIPLDMLWPMVERESDSNPELVGSSSNLLYLMYTSGSTGSPKGVPIEHGSVLNFLHSMQERPGICAEDVVLAITTITFDPSVLELILPLTVGARIAILPRADVVDPNRLLQAIDNVKPTVLQATPTSWKMLLAAGWKGAPGLKGLCGGEALSRALADQLLSRCSSLWNMYGPTETTVWSFVHEVNADDRRPGVAIGTPIPNIEAYVLDASGELVAPGVIGELFIGGAGLSRGYFNGPELTAQKFVPNPFDASGSSRLYRTGDLVRRRRDGNLEFVARADRQVKIRGHRIEPAEIESVLAQHRSIDQVAVVPLQNEDAEYQLIAYIIPAAEEENGGPGDGQHGQLICTEPSPDDRVSELRGFARRVLPEQMVPTAFVTVKHLPRNSNGKLDISALPKPEVSHNNSGYVAPSDGTEMRLARVWEEVLKVAAVGRGDNFFDLGGHSVLGAVLLTKVEKEFGRRLPLTSLFQAPTVEQMALLLRDPGSSSPWVIELQRGAPGRQPLFLVQARIGYRELAIELGTDQPVYVVLYDNLYAPGRSRTMEDIATELARKIREVQPRGPYNLGGTCLAGWVAFCIATELVRQREEVSSLVVIDAFTPAYHAGASRRTRWQRSAGHLRYHLQKLFVGNQQSRKDYLRERLQTIKWHISTKAWWKVHGFFVRTGKSLPKRLVDSTLLTAKAAFSSVGRHEPYAGKILLFRPQERPQGRMDHPLLGWDTISSQVELCVVPGDHKHLMLQPNVAVIADTVSKALEVRTIQTAGA